MLRKMSFNDGKMPVNKQRTKIKGVKLMTENAAQEQRTLPKHGEFCWTEIATNDLETCKNFYTNVFGWKYKGSDATGGGFEYLEFGTNPRNSGALYQINPDWFEGNPPPPHMLVYIAV